MHDDRDALGSKARDKWLGTVDAGMDIVPRGFEVMGRYAGAEDPFGTHTSTYLTMIAVPASAVDQLVTRKVLPKAALAGSFRLTVPYPVGMPEWVGARLCPANNHATCNAPYVALLRHTFMEVDWTSIPHDYPQFAFPIFVPFHNGQIRFSAGYAEAAERMMALKEDECHTLAMLLGLLLFIAVLYIIYLHNRMRK